MWSSSDRRRAYSLLGFAVAAFALLLALEIGTETDDVSIADMVVDGLTLMLTIGTSAAVALLALKVERVRDDRAALIADIEAARAEGEDWRRRVKAHLGDVRHALDDQFQAWKLTAAERDIALLILKGMSLKDIGIARATTEATVRQQAQSVYRKAGVGGKAALSAWFFEDLFAADSLPPDLPPMPGPLGGNGCAGDGVH